MFTLLALLLAQASSAPSLPQQVVRRSPPKPMVLGGDSCLSMSSSAIIPTIPVQLGGRELTFGLDTGAPGVVHLDPTLIESLKLTKVGEVQVSDPSLQNPVSTGIYELNGLKIGNLNVDRWVAVARPPHKSATKLDGIIGLGAFDGYVVTIDYPGSRLLLKKGRLPEPDGKYSFRYEGPIPRAPLSIEGQAIDANVDTGNSRYPLIVPQSFAARLSAYGKSYPIGVARTVNNSFDLKATPIRDSKIGEFPLYAGTAAFPSTANHGNIGSLMLRDMVVKVDPANGIVAFERAAGNLENGCPIA